MKLNALEYETLFDKAMSSYATNLGVETVHYHMGDTETPQASDSHGRDDHPTPNHGESGEAASSPPLPLLGEENEGRVGEKTFYLILNHFQYPCHLLPSPYEQSGSTTENKQ